MTDSISPRSHFHEHQLNVTNGFQGIAEPYGESLQTFDHVLSDLTCDIEAILDNIGLASLSPHSGSDTTSTLTPRMESLRVNTAIDEESHHTKHNFRRGNGILSGRLAGLEFDINQCLVRYDARLADLETRCHKSDEFVVKQHAVTDAMGQELAGFSAEFSNRIYALEKIFGEQYERWDVLEKYVVSLDTKTQLTQQSNAADKRPHTTAPSSTMTSQIQVHANNAHHRAAGPQETLSTVRLDVLETQVRGIQDAISNIKEQFDGDRRAFMSFACQTSKHIALLETQTREDACLLASMQLRLDGVECMAQNCCEMNELKLEIDKQRDQHITSLKTDMHMHERLWEEVDRKFKQNNDWGDEINKCLSTINIQQRKHEKTIIDLTSILPKVDELCSVQDLQGRRMNELHRTQKSELVKVDKMGDTVNQVLSDFARFSKCEPSRCPDEISTRGAVPKNDNAIDQVVRKMDLITADNVQLQAEQTKFKEEVSRLNNRLSMCDKVGPTYKQDIHGVLPAINVAIDRLEAHIKAIPSELKHISGLTCTSSSSHCPSAVGEATASLLTTMTLTQTTLIQAQNCVQDCRNIFSTFQKECVEFAQNCSAVRAEIVQNRTTAHTAQMDTQAALTQSQCGLDECRSMHSVIQQVYTEAQQYCNKIRAEVGKDCNDVHAARVAVQHDRTVVSAMTQGAGVVSGKRRMADASLTQEPARKARRVSSHDGSRSDYQSIEIPDQDLEDSLRTMNASHISCPGQADLRMKDQQSARVMESQPQNHGKRRVIPDTASLPATPGPSKQPRRHSAKTGRLNGISSPSQYPSPALGSKPGARRRCAGIGCLRGETMVKSSRILTSTEWNTPWFCPDHGVIDGRGGFERTLSMMPV